MNAFKMNKNTKTGRSAEPVHQSTMVGSSHMKGISPTTNGPLSSFYSAGLVLILNGFVQPKLTIGQPNDRYEQEADRVADQVMRMPEPKGSLVQRQSTCPECMEQESEPIQSKPIADQVTPLVQRQEEEEEEEPVQAKQFPNKSPPASAGLQSQVQTLRRSGQPLSKSVRSYFEPRFGADFSQVRIHTDVRTAKTAKSISAKAFTFGKDMFFGAGQYSPGTKNGNYLMAHELTHVLQQQARPFRVQRLTDPVVECTRANAAACLVHLHGSETEALAVAKDRYCQYCVNMVYINHPGCRLLRVDVPGKGITCCADPNRIFNDRAISNSWNQWNRRRMPASWGCGAGHCTGDYRKCRRYKTDAITAVKNYRDTRLLPAINRCRVIPRPQLNHRAPLPVVAFHGNTPGGLTIRSFAGSRDTARYRSRNPNHPDSKRLENAFNVLKTNPGTSRPRNPPRRATGPASLRNPHIQRGGGQKLDDFFLVTKWHDFVALVQKGRHVVLQAANPPNDGSLSVLLKSNRYINIEAERHYGRGSRSASASILLQKTMADEAFQDALGIRPGTCPAPTTPGCPACPSPTPSPTPTPTPNPTPGP
jgi:hypothetical protein